MTRHTSSESPRWLNFFQFFVNKSTSFLFLKFTDCPNPLSGRTGPFYAVPWHSPSIPGCLPLRPPGGAGRGNRESPGSHEKTVRFSRCQLPRMENLPSGAERKRTTFYIYYSTKQLSGNGNFHFQSIFSEMPKNRLIRPSQCPPEYPRSCRSHSPAPPPAWRGQPDGSSPGTPPCRRRWWVRRCWRWRR